MKESPSAKSDVAGQPGRAGRLKHLFQNLLVLCISAVFALVIFEVAVRIVRPQQLVLIRPDLWMGVDTLGWQHRSDVDIEVNTGEGPVRVITDVEGLRVGRSGRRVQADSILLIGDSFMEALQVEYEESFAGLIEDSLHGPAGQRIAVRNAGVGAWDPPQYRLFAERRLATHTYALVLVMVFVGNDVVARAPDYFPPRPRAERAELAIPLSLSPSAWIEGVGRPLNDVLEVRSHLYVLAKNATAPLRIKFGISAAYIPRAVLKERAAGPEWDVTADLLASIAQAAARRGAPALFVLIPERYQVDEELFAAHVSAYGIDTATVDLEQPSRRLLEEMTSRGLEVIDLLPAFRQVHEEGSIGPLFGSVDPHLSAAGHLTLFDTLRPRLGEILWDR